MATGKLWGDLTTAVMVVAVCVTLLGQTPSAPWIPDLGDGTFRNPVLYADYSDPDAVRVGRDYFMVSSSFSAVPGLPILHSRDLVNWSLVNHALPRLVPEDAFVLPKHGAGVWAPSIRHHHGKYWIYYPDPDHGIYLTTATDPRGTWSKPVLVKTGKGLIDPAPLWDEDGAVYLIHAFARSRAGFANVLHLNRLSPDGASVADAGQVVIDGNTLGATAKRPAYTTLEGPKLYKRNGWYYVFAPAGGVKQGWQSVFRSRRIEGPYEDRIVLAQGTTEINGPHQGALVDTTSGGWWFLHFQDAEAYGRVVHLQPVIWRDDWPVIGRDADGDGTGEPLRTSSKPRLPPSPRTAPPTSDEFANRRLGLQWQWQANPREGWITFPRSGEARLAAVPSASNLWSAPNLLLQKFPAPAFSVSVTIDASGLGDGERAGLIVFGADYAWVGVQRRGNELQMVQRKVIDAANAKAELGEDSRLLSASLIELHVEVSEGGICRFGVRNGRGVIDPIGQPFQAKPGRWVGAKVGIFATAPPAAASTGHVDVRAFTVMSGTVR